MQQQNERTHTEKKKSAAEKNLEGAKRTRRSKMGERIGGQEGSRGFQGFLKGSRRGSPNILFDSLGMCPHPRTEAACSGSRLLGLVGGSVLFDLGVRFCLGVLFCLTLLSRTAVSDFVS